MPPLGERTLPNGLHVGVLEDRRTPLAEIRIRLPLGLPGWWAVGSTDAVIGELLQRTHAARQAESIGGQFVLRTDGEWLHMEGFVTMEALPWWLDIILGVIATAQSIPDPEPAGHSLQTYDPDALLDELARLSRLGEGDAAAGEGIATQMLAPDGGTVVVVGAIHPDRALSLLAAKLAQWKRGPVTAVAEPGRATTELIQVARYDTDMVHLLLCAPEPPSSGIMDEASRFVATTIAGGYFDSRLAQRSAAHGDRSYRVWSGRDVQLSSPRCWVRANVPRVAARSVHTEIREVLQEIADRPPDRVEVTAAAEFCAAQLLGCFDAPRQLADALVHTLAHRKSVSLPAELPRLVLQAEPEAVAEVTATLYAPTRFRTFAISDLDATELFAEELHTHHQIGGQT